MAFHDETGEYLGFRPDVDEDDRDKLNEAAEIKDAFQYMQNQEMSKQIQQRDNQRHLDALASVGMTPQEYQMHLANDPAALQMIKEEAIYGATRELAQRFRNRSGNAPRARDGQGRFTSRSPKGASKPRKTLNQFRQQVSEKGKISGDSAEAVDVLDALLSQ